MIYMDESRTSMNFLDDNYKMNNLDETFDKLKCMDGINSKIVMIDKNHIT
jgi:hypothetical protein